MTDRARWEQEAGREEPTLEKARSLPDARIADLTWGEAGAESGTREAALRQQRWRAEQRLAAHGLSGRGEATAT